MSAVVDAHVQTLLAAVAHEAGLLAAAAKRGAVNAEDVALAHAIVTGRRAAPVPADGDIRLLVSPAAVRPLPAGALASAGGGAPSSGGGGGAPGAAAAASSREAAAVLAALTAAVHADAEGWAGAAGGGGGVALLLAQLSARDAAQLRAVVPALAAALRAAVEDAVVTTAAPWGPGGPGAAAGGGAAAAAAAAAEAAADARAGRALRALRLVGALVSNAGLPAEAVAGELLALTASVLLHRLPWAPAGVEGGAPGGGGGGAPAPAAKRPRVAAGEAAAAADAEAAAVAREVETRSAAAAVFAAVAARAGGAWPDAPAQAADVLLDALAESLVEPGGGGGGAGAGGGGGGGGRDGGGGGGAPVRAGQWGAAFGAAAGLAALEWAPPELLAPWRELLQRPLDAFRASRAGARGWDAAWAAAVDGALRAALDRHAGRGDAPPGGSDYAVVL